MENQVPLKGFLFCLRFRGRDMTKRNNATEENKGRRKETRNCQKGQNTVSLAQQQLSIVRTIEEYLAGKLITISTATLKGRDIRSGTKDKVAKIAGNN